MSTGENEPPSSTGCRPRQDALRLGPKRRPSTTDPLVSHGRHFGRTVHALCNVLALITNGLLRMGELADAPDESFTAEQRREHKVFTDLLQMVPNLEERLLEGSEEDVVQIAELIQKGASSARADDTKKLKGSILDWLVPRGQMLQPPISRIVKIDRGFNHERTGALLCPAGMDWSDEETKNQLRSGEMMVPGDQWPLFLYADCKYDPEDPWDGLFRNSILVSTFKHVFTSPSSVEKEAKATRSGNARIHGMTRVTPGSIAYIATQARFALSSMAVFTRSDLVTDSERFYNSVLELFYDIDEKEEVDALMTWWNRQVFPSYSSAKRAVSKNSVLAKIRACRAQRRAVSPA